MATFYILFSKSIDRYYVGSCLDCLIIFIEKLTERTVLSGIAKIKGSLT
jgi:hypothetical protein